MGKNKTLGLIDNLLDDTDGLDFLLINALAIDMEWKNVLQPVSGKEFLMKNIHMMALTLVLVMPMKNMECT